MSKDNVINGRLHPVDLPDGRVVATGGTARLDLDDEALGAYFDDGRLLRLDDVDDGDDNSDQIDRAAVRRQRAEAREAKE